MTVLALGVTLNLVGTTLSALGLLLQKLAHRTRKGDKEKEKEGCCPNAYFCNTQWVSGFGVFIAGHIVCVTAMAFCPMTVLACLNCLTMVVAVVLGALILKEPVTKTRFVGVAILCLACMWVVSYAPDGKSGYLTGEMVQENFRRPLFLYLIPSALFFGAVSALLAGYITRREDQDAAASSKKHEDEPDAEPGSSSFGQSAVGSWQGWRLPWSSCAVLAATCAWYSTIGAKALVGLGFTTVYFRKTQFYSLAPFFIALTTAAAVTGNVHLLNLSLQRGSMTVVMPLYEATSILGQVCIGGAFFGELPHSNVEKLNFFLRVAVVIGGMCILMVGPHGKPILADHDDENAGSPREEEENTGLLK